MTPFLNAVPTVPLADACRRHDPEPRFRVSLSAMKIRTRARLIACFGPAFLALVPLPARAQIGLVNTASLNDTANATSYTVSFDAGNGGTANKLIVSVGAEGGPALSGITYNDVALTFIPGTGDPASGRNRGIWYLDNPFSTGAANLVVSGYNGMTFRHMRLGIVSISGSAPGAASRNSAAAGSVALDVPVNDSFVFAAYAGNLASPASTADAPLVPIFGVASDSANAAAGYEILAVAGTATYSFTSPNSPEASAAAFVPANAAPVIIERIPADDSTEAPVAADLVAIFSEPVIAGDGTIELWQDGGVAPVESFNVADTQRLTFSGQTLTIDPTNNLTPGSGYHILVPATAIVDTSGGAAFAGISDPTAWSFTADGTAPTLVSRFPAVDAENARKAANLVATFSEPIFAGTGAIGLWQAGGASPVESFEVDTSSKLTFAGETLTIDPTAELLPGTDYFITIAASAIRDGSGNVFDGLAGETGWSFTTRASAASIAAVNTNGPSGFVQTSPPPTRSWSFDAGATSDMLIVAYSGEIGNAVQPASESRVRVSYAGYPMTPATSAAGAISGAIFHLDLSSTNYSGGAADLVVDLSDYGARSGLSIGAVSIHSGDRLIERHTTASGGANAQSVTLNTTAANAFAVASFNSNNASGTPVPAVSAPLTQIYASNNIGSARGGAGYEIGVTPGDHAYTWTLPTTNPTPRSAVAASFVIAGTTGATFADWISDPAFGIDPDDRGPDDDPDGDGIDNAVENFFGTHPGEFSQGLLAGTGGGNSFTFTHPQSATPAADLAPAYRWSTNLTDWYAGDNLDGPGGGLTVSILPAPAGPPVATVTATASQPLPGLFVRIEATAN
jgi:hypothetical protein